MNEVVDLIILGSGPAGLTAGIYASRADLETTIIAGESWGGQLMLTTTVENFPGFPEGIQGPDLMINMRKQAEKFGARVVDEKVVEINFLQKPFKLRAAEVWYQARSVIVATGAEFKWLGLESEQRLIGKGVSSCATCDAAFFKGKKVAVVGGGDAAMEEALVLARFASSVVIIHRRGSFRASKIMQEKVFANKMIKIMWNSEVIEVVGQNKVEGLRIRDIGNGKETELAADGMFVAIGHTPATEIFDGVIDLDAKGYATRKGEIYKTMSNVEGIFIAGDVHDYIYRQAITAAAYGCEAALDAERWLGRQK